MTTKAGGGPEGGKHLQGPHTHHFDIAILPVGIALCRGPKADRQCHDIHNHVRQTRLVCWDPPTLQEMQDRGWGRTSRRLHSGSRPVAVVHEAPSQRRVGADPDAAQESLEPPQQCGYSVESSRVTNGRYCVEMKELNTELRLLLKRMKN